MVEAVRKVLLASIYENGTLRAGKKAEPLKNAALSLVFKVFNGEATFTDTELGQDLRALAYGVRFLEAGFTELAKIKQKEEKEEDKGMNEAK